MERAPLFRPIVLPVLLLLIVALTGCGSNSSTAAYRPPARQLPVLPDSLNLHGCSSTTMGGGLLTLCDPVLLKTAWEEHTLTQKGDLDVEIAGRKVRVASNPGLTQVAPDDGIGSLLVPAKVTLRGRASDGSYLYIRAISHRPEHMASAEALFRHLGLAHGGTATIDVKLVDGVVAFTVHRPDGSVLEPLRFSHLEGPGPTSNVPPLPSHYADTPEQGVRTYVKAINARDGKTICELWTTVLQAQFSDERSPCWASATGLIDYGSESDSPVFQRLELLGVGKPFERSSHGVTFTAVPVRLRSHRLESRYSTTSETRDVPTTVWFRHTSVGWRIAKDPFFTGSDDPAAPPDPSAARGATGGGEQRVTPAPSRSDLRRAAARAKAERARAAKAKAAERARQAAAWAPSLVHFGRGRVRCRGREVHVADSASDVLVQRLGASKSSLQSVLRKATDIRSVGLAVAGRHVCLSVSFARQPFGERRRVALQFGLGLTYHTRTAPYVRQTSFVIESNTQLQNGLTYAGIPVGGGATHPRPAGSHFELRGNTLAVDFDLDRSFPELRPNELGGLTWALSFSATDYRADDPTATGHVAFYDVLPDNPDPTAASASPEVRQSDGKAVTPS
jgi:hypothetical protein